MLISLDKNKWLYDWMTHMWLNEISSIIGEIHPRRTTQMRYMLTNLLVSKGYTAHLTSKNDIIISMTEEEFIFLKLKYS